MDLKKTTLGTAIVAAMGGVSMSAQAALSNTATLQFDTGSPFVASCLLGTVPPCSDTRFEETDMGGSYFGMDTIDGNGSISPAEKTAISMFAPLAIAGGQVAAGSHAGNPDGSESPAIDNAWGFAGNTGMHSNSAPITWTGTGSTKTLDIPGWAVIWSGFDENNPITMPGTATLVCSTASCSDTSTYTLDMSIHVPVAFTSVAYTLHLEGHVNAVPVPAAAWLFGSGVIGLAGVARRRRNKKA